MIFNEVDVHSPYFIRNGRGGRKDWGGYSPCATGKKEIFEGSVLNNCVGLAWGLFALAENNPDCTVGFIKASTYPQDAGSWYNDGQPSKWDHYERGTFPKQGSVICYTGHVAYVNEVKENGDCVCLSSAYGSDSEKGYYIRTVTRASGYKWNGAGEFQGFIYPNKAPEPQPIPEPQVSEGAKILAKEVLQGMYGNQPFRKDNIFKAVQTYVNYLCRLRRANEGNKNL